MFAGRRRADLDPTASPRRAWLRLAPALVVVLPVFLVAVGVAVTQSLGLFPLAGDGRLSLDAYRSLAAEARLSSSLVFTSYVALVSTVLSAGLGVALALSFRRLFSGSRVWALLLQLGLPVPHLVGALAMILLLGQSGLLARVATAGGLIDAPASFPELVFDSRGVAIIAEYVWKEVPFFALITLGALGSTAGGYDAVAATLGANRPQRLRHVTLPLLAPVMLPASVVVFAFTFGTFEVPLLLGGGAPEALPVLAFRRFTNIDLAARPEAMAAGVVMMTIIALASLGYMGLGRRYAGHR